MAITWHWNEFFGIANHRFTRFESLSQYTKTICSTITITIINSSSSSIGKDSARLLTRTHSRTLCGTREKKRMLLTNRIRNSCQELETFPNYTFPVLNLSMCMCCCLYVFVHSFADAVLGDKCCIEETSLLVAIQMRQKVSSCMPVSR